MAFFTKKRTIKNPPDLDPYDLGTQSGEPAQEGDLGLGALADDQLLTLAEQARMEIWARGFALFQNIWLARVKHQDEYFKDRTEAWLQAQMGYRKRRYDALVEEANDNLQALAKKNLIKAAFSPEEEKMITSVATLDAKLAMIDAFRLKAAEEAKNAHQQWQNMTTGPAPSFGSPGPAPSFGPSSSAGQRAYGQRYPKAY